jgi:D-glycero-beta-D-manno-heptose-7-phosphate kinase
MVKLISSFRALKPIKAFVMGDFVLDTYITGSVERISPEAPVAVLHARERKHHPGMAGNVALNLISLGAQVVVCGRVGADQEGQALVTDLKKQGVDVQFVVVQKEYPTPVKHRMIAHAQQLLRVDFEEMIPLSVQLERHLIKWLPEHLAGVDVIALSDYKKGFLTRKLIQTVIRYARQNNIPLIVDPKGDDFSKYKGCTLIKPNLSEAYAAAKLNRHHPLDDVAEKILKDTAADYLLVTRSEEGMSLFNSKKKREDFKVESREVTDVTGAGDTVLAMITMGLGNKLSLSICAELSNVAASIAIQKIGCVQVTLSQIAERLLLMDNTNKIFAEEHLFALSHILRDRTSIVLGLGKHQEMTTMLFQTLKKLSSKDAQHKLIVYLADTTEREEFISLLSSLHEVDFILLSSNTLSKLFEKILPTRAFFMEQDQLREVHDPTYLLEELLMEKVR